MKIEDGAVPGFLVKALAVAGFLLLVGTVVWAEGQGQRRPPGVFDILALPRIWMGAIFCAAGLVLLMKSLVSLRVRLVFLLAAFFVFSVIAVLPLGKFAAGMGLHPSPVCTVTRPFQFIDAGRGVPTIFVVVFASVAVFTLIGNKLFCGWVCPIGALQELANRVPLSRKLKITLPFTLTNPIRIAIFALFLAIVFMASLNIYDYFNPFEFLHWGFELVGSVAIAVTLIAGLFIFRPFCYLVCPLGLITWVLEHFSLVKVRVKDELCTECNVCVKKSRCPAVPAILEGWRSRPDCHACGRCIELCPEKALAFRR
jgi:NapH/MauN family ferredoxin-type protein